MKTSSLKTILFLIAVCTCLMVFGGGVLADDSVEVKIPVSCTGADCNPALYDADGNELATLALTVNKTSEFTFDRAGLGTHIYTIKLKNTDTDKISYDKSVYTVKVHLFLDDAGKVFYVLETDPHGVIGGDEGKPDKLEFKNTVISDTGGDVKPCSTDPPVQKRIQGSPSKKSTFTFVFTAKEDSYPMPEGSSNGTKQINITGEGSTDFGTMTFTKAGVYEYTATEKNTGEAGYTYDTTIYTLHYDVTEENGQLVAKCTFYRNDKEVKDITAAVFTNVYKTSSEATAGKTTPKTGDDSMLSLWVTLLISSFTGLMILFFLTLRRRRREGC